MTNFEIAVLSGMTGFKITVLSGMTGFKIAVLSERNRTVIPAKVGIQDSKSQETVLPDKFLH
ncbi:TPA: hypothetical protein ACMHID_000341 [Neisseria gonorrhoeae]